MSPYITYGYGILASELTEETQHRIDDLSNNESYTPFYEDGYSSRDEGVYYLVSMSPFSDNIKENAEPWATTFEMIEKFKGDKQSKVSAKLSEYGISDLADKVRFFISCTEI